MNCSEVQKLLSVFHDGELHGADRAAVARHLTNCSACSAQLANFAELSHLADDLSEPQSIPEMWDAIAAKLEAPSPLVGVHRPAERRLPIPSIALALAGSVLLAVLAAVAVWNMNGGHEHDHLAVNFDAYLSKLPNDPQAAQQVLLVNYGGRRVELDEAKKSLGYMPAAGARLPEGYTLQDVYLLKMPCCECAQVVYRRAQGGVVTIFEHEKDQPVWFGDRPTIKCECNGLPTDLIQISPQQLAASWKQGERYITLIGAENIEEVKRIMTHLQNLVGRRDTSIAGVLPPLAA